MCCKKGFHDKSNGCDGTFGGKTRHECVLRPGKFCHNSLQGLIELYGLKIYTPFTQVIYKNDSERKMEQLGCLHQVH